MARIFANVEVHERTLRSWDEDVVPAVLADHGEVGSFAYSVDLIASPMNDRLGAWRVTRIAQRSLPDAVLRVRPDGATFKVVAKIGSYDARAAARWQRLLVLSTGGDFERTLDDVDPRRFQGYPDLASDLGILLGASRTCFRVWTWDREPLLQVFKSA